MSLEINSNEVQSITRNNKRVVLIVKNSDGSVIYDVGGISSILLTATSQSLCYVDNESATLTASVYDDNDEAVTGQTVNLYDSSDNLIGAMTDNDDGTYTYTYTPSSSGVVTFYAKVSGKKSNDLMISSSKRATDITFTTSSNSVVYSNTITLSGTLKHGTTGLNNVSVKIYDGNTLIDTVNTDNGVFSKSISDLGVGSHTFSAVYDGDTNYNDAISSDVSVTITQHGTTLNINVPTTLVYSDEFNITGTLTDGTNVIAGATVNLLVGSTVVDSDTTDSNGQVSFTQTPVSMGTHTFQLSYAGTTNYSGATSSTVTRDINKETSVLTVTNPSNSSSTMYSDGTLEVTGSLVTDDGEPISGATITIKESTTTLGTATTGSDGGFSKNLSLATGTHELTIGFATDTYYAASSASKTVVVSDPNISVTVAAYDSNDTQISSASSSAILSYADSEYAVLTATYLGANVSGKTISFDIVDSSTGNVIENIGSDDTDEYGVATCTYSARGVGDVVLRASIGSILSETYTIHDYPYYDASSSSNLSRYTVPSGASMTYDSTENAYLVTLTASNANKTILHTNNLNVSNTRSIQADIKLNNSGNIQGLLGLFNGTTGVFGRFIKSDTGYFNIVAVDVDGNGSQIEGVVYITVNTGVWYTLRLEFNGSSVTAKLINNGTVEQTLTSTQSTLSSSSNNLGFAVAFAQNSSYYIKNIRVE